MTSNCFRIRLGFDGLFLVLGSDIFSFFFKMTNFQGIKKFRGVFLSAKTFFFRMLTKPSTMFSFLFFPLLHIYINRYKCKKSISEVVAMQLNLGTIVSCKIPRTNKNRLERPINLEKQPHSCF